MDAADRADGARPLRGRNRRVRRCPLSETRSQVVFGSGNPDADLMLVGEAPGFHEDQGGLPFAGQAGDLLARLLAGIDLDRMTCTSRTSSSAGRHRTATRSRPRSPPASRISSARSSSSGHVSSQRSGTSRRSSSPAGRTGSRVSTARSKRPLALDDHPAVPALSPCRGAVHALDAEGPGGRLRATPAQLLGGDAVATRSARRPSEPRRHEAPIAPSSSDVAPAHVNSASSERRDRAHHAVGVRDGGVRRAARSPPSPGRRRPRPRRARRR